MRDFLSVVSLFVVMLYSMYCISAFPYFIDSLGSHLHEEITIDYYHKLMYIVIGLAVIILCKIFKKTNYK